MKLHSQRPGGNLRFSYRLCIAGFAGSPKHGHARKLRNDFFQKLRRFPLISGERVDSPVMLPPGWARLATNPEPTGSLSNPMTIGIVTVACLAARVSVGPAVTMTSTLSCTSSAASAGHDQI